MAGRVAQIQLEAAIRKFVNGMAERRGVQCAKWLGGVVGGMKVVQIDGKVLVERHLIFQFKDVQLQIAAAEIFGLEAEIIAGDGRHAQHRLVEFDGLGEIPGHDRKAIEAGYVHHTRTQTGNAKQQNTQTRTNPGNP